MCRRKNTKDYFSKDFKKRNNSIYSNKKKRQYIGEEDLIFVGG